MRDFECAGNIAGNRRVNSDARAAIHPGRRARRRSGFRAVFVLVFVGGYYVLWFFGHSLRISRKNKRRVPRTRAARNSVTEFSQARKLDATSTSRRPNTTRRQNCDSYLARFAVNLSTPPRARAQREATE